MPLLEGQVVELVPDPENIVNNHTQGWEIGFTGERFSDYDKFLGRMALYQRPIWSCQYSGRSSMTYEQAQLEERAVQQQQTGIGFSDQLVREMLQFLSQSTLSITQAVDALFYRFQYDFYMGEHIDVKYPDTGGAMYECFVVEIGPLPQKPTLGEFSAGDNSYVIGDNDRTRLSSPVPTSAVIARLGDNADSLIAHEERRHRIYTVRLYDVDGNPINDSDISVSATELSRSRNVFTKVGLRQFLDQHMRRDPRANCPWVIRPEWRERFHIPYMFAGAARILRSVRVPKRVSDVFSEQTMEQPVYPSNGVTQVGNTNRKLVVDPYADERGVGIKPVRKFPADDLEHLQYQHAHFAQSLLWALRRKHEKTNGKETGKASTHRQITDFFAVAGNGTEGKEKVENGAETKEEEEEEELRNRWPVPLCEWQVPKELVSRVLAMYMFVSCFSTPLKLNPYPLDYFETALVQVKAETETNNRAPASSVYRETVIALLNSLIADRQNNQQDPTNVAARIVAMNKDQDGNMSEPEDLQTTSVEEINGENSGGSEEAAKPDDTMDVDVVDEAVVVKRGRNSRDELPPVGRHATRRVAQGHAKGRLATRRGRTHRGSLLSGSSSIASSDSSDESVASTATAGSRRRGGRSGRSTRNSTRARRRGSSRAATPPGDADEVENAVVAELANIRGHRLLRHLSRTWAKESVGSSRAGWAARLAGWIIEASYDYAELVQVREALWAAADLEVADVEAVLWNALDMEARLLLLELLVAECTNNESIRMYLDSCAETTADLKRERLELRRELKRLTEQTEDLNRADAAQQKLQGASREEARRQQEEETQRQRERRRLGESERQQRRRLDYVERELRRNSVGRLAPLGSDRFFNRYYFLDGIGSCPATGGTGRILVQPAQPSERNEALQGLAPYVASNWALHLPPPWSAGLRVAPRDMQLSADVPADAEQIRLASNGDLWGYYATTAQVDELRRWLDPRGRREAALLAELDLLQAPVAASMRRRCQELEQSFTARLRVREHLCDQISAHMDAVTLSEDAEPDEQLAALNRELAAIDSTHVPPALLPPTMALEQQQEHKPGNGILNGVANGVDQNNYSSRASSVDPPSSVEQQSGALQNNISKRLVPPRRRGRPKRGTRRFKTYMDEFLAYENTLFL
ncbi:hypothetical protein H4S08_003011 [Coemansia sp. RSA 1365]|nr:hypothetical protein H4S08_003011 [Coemansia sp. RSA 1365]